MAKGQVGKRDGSSARAKVKAAVLDAKVNPVGRPRTTTADLPEGWQQIMKDEAQIGGGPTAYMVKLGIGNHAINTLLEDSEEFRNIYEQCLLLCAYWWENTGKNMASGAQGSAPVWAMNMTNRFNWRSNRSEVVGDPTAPVQQKVEVEKRHLTKEELIAELEARGLPTAPFQD